MLRDLIRTISARLTVGLVDERGEIAAIHKGIPGNDVGINTDVLDNVPKYIGMKMLIRSMNPNVIAADEIGSIDDVRAINYAACSGVKGIFTAHGKTFEDIKLNEALKMLIENNTFERIIFLNNREIKEVYGSKIDLR